MRGRFPGSGRPTARGGMSLIEVLVTITIVMILAGLLLGVIIYARARALQVHCQQNLRNFYAAIMVYKDENNDYIPRASGHGSDWYEAIQPQLLGVEYGAPPLDPAKIDTYHCKPVPHLALAYCINAFDEGANGPTPFQWLGSIEKMVLFTESLRDPGAPSMGYSDVTSADHLPGGASPRIPSARHRHGINVMYADGHAGFVGDPEVNLTVEDFSPPEP